MDKMVHFVEWRKLPVETWPALLGELPSWGVESIVAHPAWGHLEAERPGALAEIKRECDAAGLAVPACHGYWGAGNDPGCADERRRRETVAEHAGFLRRLAAFGVKTYTLHLGLEETADPWTPVRRSVEELLPVAREHGIVLALENGSEPRLRLEQLVALADEFDCPEVGFCFDTGHAHCYSGGVEPTLELMARRIVTLHVHDNYGSFDDHNPPGGGTIDWKKVAPLLKALPELRHAETESGDWSRNAWNAFQAMWN